MCVAITFFAVSLLPQPQKEQILASQTGHYIVVLIDKTDSVVPPEIHDVIGPYLHRIEQQLDPNNQYNSQHANWPQAAFPEWPSLPSSNSNSIPAQPAATPLPTWPPAPQNNGGAY